MDVYHFSFPSMEEPQMTLQIAMGGIDGFVVASDRKGSTGGWLADSGHFSVEQTTDIRKILVSSKGDLVCAFSVNEVAAEIAWRLIESERPCLDSYGAVHDYLRDRCDEFRLKYDEKYRPTGPALIVGIPNACSGVKKLWQVNFCPIPVVAPSDFRFYGGYGGNSATFFAEMFHGGSQSRPTEELVILSALVVLEGQRLNPAHIGGLDVLVAKDKQAPRFLTDAERHEIENRASAIHEKMQSVIFSKESAT